MGDTVPDTDPDIVRDMEGDADGELTDPTALAAATALAWKMASSWWGVR
jgi:hypothetical protein